MLIIGMSVPLKLVRHRPAYLFGMLIVSLVQAQLCVSLCLSGNDGLLLLCFALEYCVGDP